MAIIKPFKGIRPPQDLVEQVASRPYDVLNSAEARAEAEGNEKSLYHIIKPEIDFPVGTDEHDERVYRKAAENFRMFQEKGWLVQDDKENYYRNLRNPWLLILLMFAIFAVINHSIVFGVLALISLIPVLVYQIQIMHNRQEAKTQE